MPQVPKEIVPEKKVSIPIPEEPEAPPVQGTWLLYKSWKDDSCLHLALVVDGSYVFICCLSYVLKLISWGHLKNMLLSLTKMICCNLAVTGFPCELSLKYNTVFFKLKSLLRK